MLAAVYVFANSAIAVMWGVGVIALTAGLVLAWRGKGRNARLFSFTIAALMFGIFAPSMKVDRIEVTTDSFFQRAGMWFYPIEYRFRFEELRDIQIVQITKDSRRGTTQPALQVTKLDGTQSQIPLSGLFESNQAAIVQDINSSIQALRDKH